MAQYCGFIRLQNRSLKMHSPLRKAAMVVCLITGLVLYKFFDNRWISEGLGLTFMLLGLFLGLPFYRQKLQEAGV